MAVHEHETTSKGHTEAAAKWIRYGAFAAVLAGVLYILAAPIEALYPVAVNNNAGLAGFASQALIAAAMLFMIGGLAGVHIRQRDTYGRLGTIGFIAAIVGAVLTPPQIAYILATGGDPPVWILAGAILPMFVGTVLLGIATVLADVLPRWCGLALMLFFPSMFFGGFMPGLGALLPGLIWLALGYALWSKRGETTTGPSSTNDEDAQVG